MQIDRSKGRPLLIRYNYDYPPYKWLFVVPGLNRVKRAINESEVDFINYQTELPNFRVIKEDEVDETNELNYYIKTKIMSEKLLQDYIEKGLY